jgi:hypothetical protein
MIWMPCSRYPLSTTTIRLESWLKVIATGIEPSAMPTPTGSSTAPVGSRCGSCAAGWQAQQNARSAAKGRRRTIYPPRFFATSLAAAISRSISPSLL